MLLSAKFLPPATLPLIKIYSPHTYKYSRESFISELLVSGGNTRLLLLGGEELGIAVTCELSLHYACITSLRQLPTLPSQVLPDVEGQCHLLPKTHQSNVSNAFPDREQISIRCSWWPCVHWHHEGWGMLLESEEEGGVCYVSVGCQQLRFERLSWVHT